MNGSGDRGWLPVGSSFVAARVMRAARLAAPTWLRPCRPMLNAPANRPYRSSCRPTGLGAIRPHTRPCRRDAGVPKPRFADVPFGIWNREASFLALPRPGKRATGENLRRQTGKRMISGPAARVAARTGGRDLRQLRTSPRALGSFSPVRATTIDQTAVEDAVEVHSGCGTTARGLSDLCAQRPGADTAWLGAIRLPI